MYKLDILVPKVRYFSTSTAGAAYHDAEGVENAVRIAQSPASEVSVFVVLYQ